MLVSGTLSRARAWHGSRNAGRRVRRNRRATRSKRVRSVGHDVAVLRSIDGGFLLDVHFACLHEACPMRLDLRLPTESNMSTPTPTNKARVQLCWPRDHFREVRLYVAGVSCQNTAVILGSGSPASIAVPGLCSSRWVSTSYSPTSSAGTFRPGPWPDAPRQDACAQTLPFLITSVTMPLQNLSAEGCLVQTLSAEACKATNGRVREESLWRISCQAGLLGTDCGAKRPSLGATIGAKRSLSARNPPQVVLPYLFVGCPEASAERARTSHISVDSFCQGLVTEVSSPSPWPPSPESGRARRCSRTCCQSTWQSHFSQKNNSTLQPKWLQKIHMRGVHDTHTRNPHYC